MFDLDNWQEIWSTITRNKTRSFLTAFGVFWGLFMLIILMGIGNGFRGGVGNMFEGFKTNTVGFYTNRTGEAYKGYRKGRWWRMNTRDLAIIRAKSISVDLISPTLNGSSAEDNTVRGMKSGSYSNQGVMPDFFQIYEMNILYGRVLNQVDIDQRRKVCVIGKEVYETLFDIGENPIGETIRLNRMTFTVVGVISPKSMVWVGGDPNNSVYIPFSTMQHTFSRGDSFYMMMCTAKPGIPASIVEEEVSGILKANHDIAPNDQKAVSTFNMEKEFKQFQGLFTGIDVLVLIVGLGALFSGIIGISNIMLVTVRERTREIGVRRALGAKPFNIIRQIMSESFVLTAIAGLAGFILAVGILAIISQSMSLSTDTGERVVLFGPPLISFKLALGAMGILILSGAIAGLMPALKALQIKAIDAIRDE